MGLGHSFLLTFYFNVIDTVKIKCEQMGKLKLRKQIGIEGKD